MSKFTSRKLLLALAFLGSGLWFGTHCIEMGVKLTEAGVFWGAVGAPLVGYFFANVKETTNGRNN